MQVSRSDRIGFVGLGNIGLPMANALLRDRWSLTVYDIKAENSRQCAEAGADVADSVEGLAECAVVALAVSDDDAVSAVLEGSGLLKRLTAGSVVLVHSTVLPTTARRLADEADRHGVALLDAPVSGGASRAEAGDLTVMVGGSEDGLTRVKPVLESLASDIIHVGDVGAGAAVKLANQLVMFASLAGAFEAIDFARAFGASEKVILEVLGSSTGDTWVTRNWGFFESLARTYDESSVPVKFRPWSKDLWDLVHAARLADVQVPVTGLLAQLMSAMVESRAKTTDR